MRLSFVNGDVGNNITNIQCSLSFVNGNVGNNITNIQYVLWFVNRYVIGQY